MRSLLPIVLAILVQGVWGPCYAQESQTITLSIELTGAQSIKGWSVALSFDPDQASYISNSFQAGSFMPGFVPLVLEKETGVEVGGAILGADPVSGTGTVGQLQFIISAPPNTVEIVVTEYAVSSEGRGDQRQSIQSIVSLQNTAPAGDFTDDGTVDFADFFLFADHFGGAELRYDIVANGLVDFSDFFLFADSFGKSGEIVGHITIAAESITETQEVVIIGSIDTGEAGTVDVSGSIAPEDTVNVEVVGTIEE